MAWGRLYGLGVGPGDPELITLKAKRILAAVKIVFLPRAETKEASLALSIAGQFLQEDCLRRELVFPMTRDRVKLDHYWRRGADEIAQALSDGADGAFLTLGDSTLYSTFTYVQRKIRETYPGIETVIVPGVNAPSACAAAWGHPLAEASEKLALVPAARVAELPSILNRFDTVVLMKVGKKLPQIISVLEAEGLAGNGVFLTRVGLDGERLVEDLAQLKYAEESDSYLSTIIIRKERKRESR